MRHLLTIGDLDNDQIDALLDRATALGAGADVLRWDRPRVAGFCFATSSLRTRVGNETAAVRLGVGAVEVAGVRWTEAMSEGESFSDTLRTLSGMVDIVVGRTPFELDPAVIEEHAVVPYINGGDGRGHHPTQALIDLHAIRGCGEVAGMSIGIVGDLSARSVRSLLDVLARTPPARLVLIGPAVPDEVALPSALAGVATRVTNLDLHGMDVVYVAGLPGQVGSTPIDAVTRSRYRLDIEHLDHLAPSARVLSPLPVIDEIALDARRDPRVQMFGQSDAGVFVRMAVLEAALAQANPPGRSAGWHPTFERMASRFRSHGTAVTP